MGARGLGICRTIGWQDEYLEMADYVLKGRWGFWKSSLDVTQYWFQSEEKRDEAQCVTESESECHVRFPLYCQLIQQHAIGFWPVVRLRNTRSRSLVQPAHPNGSSTSK